MGISANLFVNQKGTTTALKQPKEIGYYSRNQTEEYLVSDDINLRYYYLPDQEIERGIDLSAGASKFRDVAKDFKDRCSLKGLLDTLMEYEKKKNKKSNVDIITFRGIMSKLIRASMEPPNFNKVDLRIVSYDGQLFIKDVSDYNAATNESNSSGVNSKQQAGTSRQQIDTYTGYKFEGIATLDKPLPYVEREVIEKRPRKILNNGDEYITVVRTGVGECKVVLGAEIDCIFDFKEEGKDNLKHYTELKCSSQISTTNDVRRFEKKMFRAWLQCFLVGVPRVIYGFRDDQYMLKTVEEFSTEEIPVIIKANNPTLGQSCLDAIKWYGLFTDWLLKIIPREQSGNIRAYRLVYENNHLRLSEIEEQDGEYSRYVLEDGILTPEFKEWRESLRVPSEETPKAD
ncbi:RAI1 like PD-(D/E)XK nuclease [Nakaseomyces glabratus]|nr:RAI1 like PD-(D/E)XK nuclease [Nakaseomyces glabratus]KAH7607814.1 RAI1 like PD-(D/E)XK nuclease [Nakaseomyces glabratus]KAH7614965.1 RAI1 like PD-(D/E)XK nuclease [Nakaseomyces glabratus]